MSVDQPPLSPTPSTAPRIYPIDLRVQTPYEAGALLLVLTAFPKESEEELAKFFTSLCAAALIARSKIDVEWATACQAIKPVHFALPPEIVKKRMRKFERALRDRMVAGRIANAIIFNAAGLSPKLPKDCDGFTIKQLIKMALTDLGQTDAENAEHRVWRASLPAVHLAAAVQAYLNLPENEQARVRWGDIIFDNDAVNWIAMRAIQNWQVMQNHPERSTFGKHQPILLVPIAPGIKEIATP